jgi:formamidopyrimidine-DNA glycosylase
VRALGERLDAELAGLRIVDVAVLGFSGLKTVAPTPHGFVGSTLRGVTSRGKYLVLDAGDVGRAVLHLGNSGRVDLERPPKLTRPRGALVRLTFDGVAVLVREHGRERRAGLWVLAPDDEGPMATLGPEPYDDGFRELILHGHDRRHLHTMLRDQHAVAGIGRGFADDLLHRAGLSPFATLAKLDREGRQRLYDATLAVLHEALDDERRRTGGLSEASLGDRFSIHRHVGEPCPTCGRRLERVSFESYEIAYCPDCQTKGKVLADRRLSRLLR